MNIKSRIAANTLLGVDTNILTEVEVSSGFDGNPDTAIIKRCFDNVFSYCIAQPKRYQYCLAVGYGVIPFEHSIIYDVCLDKYFDPTLEFNSFTLSDYKYDLIKKFNYEDFNDHLMKFGYPPMLMHCSSLLKKNKAAQPSKVESVDVENGFDEAKFLEIMLN